MPPVSRRTVLALAAGAATVLGTAGCARDEGPDELEVPWAAARSDAALASSSARAFPDAAARLTPVAEARRAHADALGAEIRRARPDRSAVLDAPAPDPAAPAAAAAAVAGLRQALASARDTAAMLVPTTARYRAGLVASVTASCAGWAEVLGS